ncbi:SMP-30/gluconolactonase/LRE family protein [Rhodovibrionaceae bacterium A322]
MISLDLVSFSGNNLQRPECVLTTSNGRLYAADWRGGVTILEPDGQQWSLLAKDPELNIRPNGICLMPDGSFLLAHLGDDAGGVFRLQENGDVLPFCMEADGIPLPPTNYVHLDSLGRIWITVSTRQIPRADAYRSDRADGFIVLVDSQGARVVAGDLGYTNECLVHPDGKRLFVNETFARCLSTYDIARDGSLSNKQVFAEFGPGVFPDGLTFDQEGGVWITSIVSNRILRIDPQGQQEVVLEDNDPAHLAWVEAAYQSHSMGRPHLDQIKSQKLPNISSLAFGGPDLKTAYLGCLLGQQIASFPAPLAGHPPSHWLFPGPRRSASHQPSTGSEQLQE